MFPVANTSHRYSDIMLKYRQLNSSLDFNIEYLTLLTNVVGWTHVIDAFYNILNHQGFGHLVAITSIGGLRGELQAPAYSASKAYQINYMEALCKRAYKDGRVDVTDIRSGLVNTRMVKGENLFWMMPVEKVISQIIKVIKQKKSKAYVIKRFHILAIIIKNLPYSLSNEYKFRVEKNDNRNDCIQGNTARTTKAMS